eukprot:scaffold9505_cov202-Alexandrium_tamarense.AAC.4
MQTFDVERGGVESDLQSNWPGMIRLFALEAREWWWEVEVGEVPHVVTNCGQRESFVGATHSKKNVRTKKENLTL